MALTRPSPLPLLEPGLHRDCVCSCGHLSRAEEVLPRSNGSPASVHRPGFQAPYPRQPPPTAGKGTEGHRETAEKTRHAPVRPLNTGATAKGSEKCAPRMVHMPARFWACAEQTHGGENAYIHAEGWDLHRWARAWTLTCVQTCEVCFHI